MDHFPAAAPQGRHWTEREHLLHFLNSNDVTCPRCGYPLRGIPDPVCPGCDNELALSLGAEGVSYTPWILLLVASSVCAGLGLFYILLIMAEGWPPYRNRISDAVFCLTKIGLFLMIPTPGVVYRGRIRIWRRSRISGHPDCEYRLPDHADLLSAEKDHERKSRLATPQRRRCGRRITVESLLARTGCGLPCLWLQRAQPDIRAMPGVRS